MEDKYYYSKQLFQAMIAFAINALILTGLLMNSVDPSVFIAHLIISIGVGIVLWVQGYVGAGVVLIFSFPAALLFGFGLYISILSLSF